MAYYLINKTGTSDISSHTLYQLKRVNTIVDRPTGSGEDVHIGSQGSTVSGSHLGPGLNPWQSQYLGIGSTNANAGLMGFNSPFNTLAESSMQFLREYDWKFNPNSYGERGVQLAFYDATTSAVQIFPEVRSPQWNMGKTAQIYFYAIDSPGNGMALTNMNFIVALQRTVSGTNKMGIDVGYVTNTGNNINTISSYADTTFDVSNGTLVPLNIGQGEGDPYNEGSELGSSTQFVCHYRNASAQNKARVITVNTNYSATPSVSAGAEQSPTNRGNPVFTHGGVNMGKGAAWAGFHRGGNYQRVQYAYWTSGTTFSTISDLLVSSRSSSNTLNHGWMVKLTDELALWFYPRRSGNTSGSSRLIAVTALETSGAGKTPVVRGSTELATHDIGSISTEACTAAVGSSDTAGTVLGVVAWAENSSGNSALNIMPWKYVASTNSMTFETTKIHVTDTSYTGTNTYRMHVGIKCLGYMADEGYNYYELDIPQGEASGGGVTQLLIKQNAAASGGGAISETDVLDVNSSAYPTTAQVVIQQSFLNYPTGRIWFLGSVPNNYQGAHWVMRGWRQTDGYLYFKGQSYNS